MGTSEAGRERGSRSTLWARGDVYESYFGRWSRKVAWEFIAWLEVPDAATWLDVGCGTGALGTAILTQAGPRKVVGVDPSAGFIAHARANMTNPAARFDQGSAQDLPYADDSFDAVVSGLVLNFVPEPPRAVAEMTRVARSGGTVAAYVWDYAGQMQLMRHFWAAAVALDPAARILDEGQRSPLCQPGPLGDTFRHAGLDDVEVRAIDIPTVFRDFDDYWSPFLGGHAPAPAYAVSLDEERRSALRDRLRASLPIASDGSIHLIARAWAVRGHG